MSKFVKEWQIKGDKQNSDFFNEFLPKIYDRREKSGLEELITGIEAVVVQVKAGGALDFIAELYLMTPYRFSIGFINQTHKIYFLVNRQNTPDYIILEPHSPDYKDQFTALNGLYPRGREITQARYLGEMFHTKDLDKTVEILSKQQVRFQEPGHIKNQFLANKNYRISDISYFTNNIVIYSEVKLRDCRALRMGEIFDLTPEDKEKLAKVDKLQKDYGLYELLLGLDHLATRVLSGSREDAILEFVTMTNYYFWGAYNIKEMNSSTNVTRNSTVESELSSPAKVFTANNTPYYTKSIDGLPSPTEDFVRNFGPRMHHLAYAVVDGAREDGMKNIDYVVGKLDSEDIPFLAKVIGECTDFPDLKQIFSKSSQYSKLITEYVQRCHGFQGFFTKDNVAFLTEAAGEDEALKKSDVCD